MIVGIGKQLEGLLGKDVAILFEKYCYWEK